MSSTSLWYATRASGIVALVLLTLTMVLGLATTSRARARHWPGFAQQELHRRISILAVVFVAIHVLTSILDTFVHIGWLAIIVPFASPYSRFWVGMGTVALDLMVAVFVSSLLRSRGEAEHVAGDPLAGLWILAGGGGPYLRNGDRCGRTLGDRARRRLHPLGWRRPAVARAGGRGPERSARRGQGSGDSSDEVGAHAAIRSTST